MGDEEKKKTAAYDCSPVFRRVNEFFTAYLRERNIEKALDILSDDVLCIGIGEEKTANGKNELRKLMETELNHIVHGSAGFSVEAYQEMSRGERCWNCMLRMTIEMITAGGMKTRFPIRISIGLHLEDGRYLIDLVHVSAIGSHQVPKIYFPLKKMPEVYGNMDMELQMDFLKIVEQLIPGGVVGTYLEDGYPLYVANDKFLKLAGYRNYAEFARDIGGRIANCIHPEDREHVQKEIEQAFKSKDQYEVQYRMKRKDGTYIWVSDIGKKIWDENSRTGIISLITDISEQWDKKRQMEKALSRDSLTGLYNRQSGEERITDALNEGRPYMLFMLDLDNFKRVNDIYGHAQGDNVLRQFGKLAKKSFRKEDTICRMGGDEFMIFVNGTSDVKAIMTKMNRLIEAYRQMIEENWPESHSTLSAGGVWSASCRNFKELYQEADRILYEVKNTRKGSAEIREMRYKTEKKTE